MGPGQYDTYVRNIYKTIAPYFPVENGITCIWRHRLPGLDYIESRNSLGWKEPLILCSYSPAVGRDICH